MLIFYLVVIVRGGTSRRRPLPRYKNRDSSLAIPLLFIHRFSTLLADGVLVVPSRLRQQKRILVVRVDCLLVH